MAKNSIDLNKVRKIVTQFRNAILACKSVDLPIGLRDFPKGACGDATALLGIHLQKRGCGSLDYVCGNRHGHSHAWLQKGDIIIDITADQFEDVEETVIVTRDDHWHREFLEESRHSADLSTYDDPTKTVLSSAYEQIISNLKNNHN